MEFLLLGPLEARDDGRDLALGGPRQRAVLAMLLLDAGRVVTVERLIDGLWGDTPPASARESVHFFVHRLRKALGGTHDGVLVTRGGGYLAQVEPDQVDVLRFQRLVDEARAARAAGGQATAATRLDEALALWRGRPLADVGGAPFAPAAVARLEELHAAAQEERADAAIALGEHAAVVPELERLVTEHPLRERMWAQLMLALYRSGRQAEALRAYQSAREVLVTDLGIEPGLELRRLERAILTGDPALVPQPADGVRSAAPSRSWSPPRRRGPRRCATPRTTWPGWRPRPSASGR